MRYVFMFLPFANTLAVYILWKTSEENSHLTDKIFRKVNLVFPAVALILIVLPFFIKVSIGWIIFFAIAISAFSLVYYRTKINRIWMLCAGFILLRMTYAVIFIPLQEKGIRINYRNVVADMLAASKGEEIIYWTKPQTFNLGIYTKYIQWNAADIILPPFIYCQFPHYNYYFTGRPGGL